MIKVFTLLNLAFLAVPLLAASTDQITLKNGDRLSGSILKSDAKELTIQTEFAGTVKVQWEAITGITANQPLNLVLKDGQNVVGTVVTNGDQFTVKTENAGTVTAAKAVVTAVRSKGEQAAYEAELERYRNPGLLDLWSGFVDTGWAKSSGNSSTSAFNMGVNAARVTRRDKLSIYSTIIRASNATSGTKVLTANAARGGARYELNVSPKMFAFGFTDIEADEFQKLDLRVAPGGGFGYHAYKKEANFFDLFGGGSYNREFFFNNVSRSSAEVLFGDELGWQFYKSFGVTEKFVFFPNVSDTGQYRINFDASAVTKLAKWLSWQVTMSDRYLSLPVVGTKSNDVLFTTGVRVTFVK